MLLPVHILNYFENFKSYSGIMFKLMDYNFIISTISCHKDTETSRIIIKLMNNMKPYNIQILVPTYNSPCNGRHNLHTTLT